MSLFGGLFGGDTGKATKRAAQQNIALLRDFQVRANEGINAGTAAATTQLGRLGDLYQPIMDRGTQGANLHADAMGLNGAEGTARAQSAFTSGPGYQFAQDEAQRAGLRAASAGGMLASGNTLAALADRSQGIANQEYQTWLGNLAPYANMELAGAQGVGGSYEGLANLGYGSELDKLGLESGVLSGIMGANNQIAQADEAKAASRGGLFGNIVKAGLGFATGGPAGAAFSIFGG